MADSPHTVDDVMTTTVVAVAPDARFKEVVATLERWKVTAVPVLEGEGRVVGVVSEADLLSTEEARDRRPGMIDRLPPLDEDAGARAVTAGSLMTAPAPAVTVRSGASLPHAARVMARHGVKRLPVVDDAGVIQGIVSRADLLKVFLRTDADIAAEVRKEVVDPLFPLSAPDIRVEVADGVVTLSGTVHDGRLVPTAARLAYAVEGVVGVSCELIGPAHIHPHGDER
ncbi:CBS domain-containing protein [Streptomyces sp. NPDC091376]|uniref:CBS domain-containing protein n=1 Tax=Streptomyces sp. NPDC091376 TaxID=3365994 RepID=UPI0037FF6F42